MRSPAVVFSLVAVTALSPSLVLGSPVPHSRAPATYARLPAGAPPLAARGLGFLNDVFARAEQPHPTSQPKLATVAGYKLGRREFWKKDEDMVATHQLSHHKRLDDGQTKGGNAHTGTAGAVDGGSVDAGDNGGMPVLMNVHSNNAGSGGSSDTGCAAGGKGDEGGNASSGDSGNATGGRVRGSGGMVNMDSNNAGDAGKSSSGCAEAGYSAGAGANSQEAAASHAGA